MENIIQGFTTLSICAIGYYFSVLLFLRGKTTLSLGVIIACGLLLRVYAGFDFYLHTWDERYHALVAKNLLDNPFMPVLYKNPALPYDFKNWTANHVWLHKQPVPLWGIATSFYLFGVNEITLRLPSIILSTVGIVFTFFIGKYLFNFKVAFIAAFLHSIHGLIIELASGRTATDHIDVFFLFFIQLAVVCAIKFFQTRKEVYNIICAISIGLAILSKWLPALIVLPIWVLIGLHERTFSLKALTSRFVILSIVLSMVFLPWQIYIFNKFPLEAAWESSFNTKHLFEALENHGQPFYYHFNKMRMIYGELIYLPFLWILYKGYKRPLNFKRIVLIVWILIPFVFFSFAKTKMQAYTVFTAPAIFIVTALFFHYLSFYLGRFKLKPLIVVVLFLLIALPIRYSIERIKPFEERERRPNQTLELKELKHALGSQRNVLIFNAEAPIETMFYADCIAYSEIPETPILQELHNKGFNVYIRRRLTLNANPKSVKNDIVIPKYNVIYVLWSNSLKAIQN